MVGVMWHKGALRLLCVGFAVALSSGCGRAEFEEVSSQPEHREVVGSRFKTRKAMNLSGINLPPGYGDSVDTCALERMSPTWSGPELIFRSQIKAGTELALVGVEKCTNCYLDFDPRIHYIVELDADRCRSVKVFIRAQDFTDEYLAPIMLPHNSSLNPTSEPRRGSDSLRPSGSGAG